jgi:hypothetical protein
MGARWDLTYPTAPEDDTAINIVFVTAGHGHDTVWVVVDWGDSPMRYAQVSPASGPAPWTFTVSQTGRPPAPRSRTTSQRSPPFVQAAFQQFADGFGDFLGECERLIAAAVADGKSFGIWSGADWRRIVVRPDPNGRRTPWCRGLRTPEAARAVARPTPRQTMPAAVLR